MLFPKMLTTFVDSLLICFPWFFYVSLKHVYIPLLFYSGVDYIDAPTPYMMGLHSGVDTSALAMDGVSHYLFRSSPPLILKKIQFLAE